MTDTTTVVRLTRFHAGTDATFGFLHYGPHTLFTLEPERTQYGGWGDCIPVGTYNVEMHHSAKLGETLKIFNVPGRTDILIHVGNTPSNTTGCILPGRFASMQSGQQSVGASRDALSHLIGWLQCHPRPWTIVIDENIPTAQKESL